MKEKEVCDPWGISMVASHFSAVFFFLLHSLQEKQIFTGPDMAARPPVYQLRICQLLSATVTFISL